EGDADVLRFLEAQEFPDERLAHPEAVSVHDGQAVLVTRFIEGFQPKDRSQSTFQAVGDLVGRLHSLPDGTGGPARKGGAIHAFTLGEGSLRDEVADAMSWLAEADVPPQHKPSYDSMLEKVSRIERRRSAAGVAPPRSRAEELHRDRDRSACSN